MKKAYINPETSVVLLTMQTLIAATNPEGFNGNLDDEQTITPEEMLSRRRTVWDDEELDDFDEEF